jgi:hypothetical protein
MRVVASLKRLEVAGKVVQEVRWQKDTSKWHPARGGGGDA